jgi:hypothetical protein
LTPTASNISLVHTQTDTAAAFWRHYELEPLPGNQQHLFLSMRDARGQIEP